MSATRLVTGLQRAVGHEHLGYGAFGLALERGLTSLGVKCVTPADMSYYKTPAKNLGCILWASQPGHCSGAWEGQHTAIFTMWESTILPDSFISNIHNFDTVLVPNDSNVELFKVYNPNVYKVPLGFESQTWPLMSRTEPMSTFKFLHCAAGAAEKARKGTDLVLEAFELAFPHWKEMKPSPRLTVKCLKHPPAEREFLTIQKGVWQVPAMQMLYRDHHAMVIPSRGEGWGYHPLQAVATGMPTILSAIPGHTEFSYLPGFYEVPVTETKAAKFLQGDGGNWWEPDLDSIVEGMREVYEHYDRWENDARAGSWDAHNKFSERHMSQRVLDILGEHMHFTETGDWKKFTELQFRTVTNRNMHESECDIGGTRYNLRMGDEYWTPANVRLVLGEAGYLANPDEHTFRMVQ